MDDIQPLVVFSMPVSGGCFIAQVSLYLELYRSRCKIHDGKFPSYKAYTPDLCFGSSGGNVALYILLCSDWESNNIIRTLCSLESDMFIKSWFPDHMNFIPTGILGVFNGSLYRSGYGAEYIFKRYFNCKTFQNTEIWTGTYNISTNKAEFFCNRSKHNALVQQQFFEPDMESYCSMPLRYISDEPDPLCLCAKTAMASAAIPIIVPKQKIGKHLYSDGGIMYASGTLPLANEIFRVVKGHCYPKESIMDKCGNISVKQKILPPRKLRHFYFSPYDMYSKEIVESSRTINGPISQILYSCLLQDKASAIENLQRIYGVESNQLTHEHYIDVDQDTLPDLLVRLEKYDHYVVDLYPKGLVKIPLKNFTPEMMKQKIEYVRDNNYSIQVWYYEQD